MLFDVLVLVFCFFFQLSPISQLTEGTIEAKDILGIYSQFMRNCWAGWPVGRVLKLRHTCLLWYAKYSSSRQSTLPFLRGHRGRPCVPARSRVRRGAGSHHRCCAGRGGRGVGSRSTGHGAAAPGAAAALVGPLLLGRWVTVIFVAGAPTTFCFGSNSLMLIERWPDFWCVLKTLASVYYLTLLTSLYHL